MCYITFEKFEYRGSFLIEKGGYKSCMKVQLRTDKMFNYRQFCELIFGGIFIYLNAFGRFLLNKLLKTNVISNTLYPVINSSSCTSLKA